MLCRDLSVDKEEEEEKSAKIAMVKKTTSMNKWWHFMTITAIAIDEREKKKIQEKYEHEKSFTIAMKMKKKTFLKRKREIVSGRILFTSWKKKIQHCSKSGKNHN